MGVRLQHPGHYATAAGGRVYLIAYQRPTDVTIEAAIWADYQRHREAVGGRTLVLATAEHPVFPLPSVEVRAFWRRSMQIGSGVEGFAVLGHGFVGLAAAAMTHLLEHMVDPLHGIRFRVFARPEPALAWLAEVAPLDAAPAELLASLAEIRGHEHARSSA